MVGIQVADSPTLQNLARALAYHQRCADEEFLSLQAAERSQVCKAYEKRTGVMHFRGPKCGRSGEHIAKCLTNVDANMHAMCDPQLMGWRLVNAAVVWPNS